MKTCSRCGAVKPYALFYKQRMNSKDGYQAHCKQCDNVRVAERKARNPERAKATQAVSDRNKYTRSKTVVLARNKAWKQANYEKMQAADAKRRAAKMQRTPKWLSSDDFWLLEQAYALAVLRTKMFGFDWHVDHIVPLQGALVSGLHVPHNVQVITASANCRKANKFAIS